MGFVMSKQEMINDKETVINDYLAGVHGTTLAKRYGVMPNALYGFLRSQGIAIRARGGSTAKYNSFTDRFIELYQQGKTIQQIAKDLNVGTGTVQRAIAKHGTPRPNGTRSQTITIPIDLAIIGYVAGLLDGEGNLQLKEDHGSITCKLSIYNTSKEVIDWLVETIGGKVRIRDQEGWKRCYIWTLYRAQDIYVLLKVLQPYLIIKREKCQILLDVLSLKLQ